MKKFNECGWFPTETLENEHELENMWIFIISPLMYVVYLFEVASVQDGNMRYTELSDCMKNMAIR